MVIAELNSTRTARWYDGALGCSRSDAWAERLRCYGVLSELLAGQATAQNRQPQIAPRGLITEVARRANFSAHETVYKRFRSEWDGPIARWAGTDETVKPRNALVAEAKIVSFWAYRNGVLQIAGRFAMSLPEVTEAYLRALATWAADDIPLAACRPAGAPPCVAEDMEVLARAWLQRGVPAPRMTAEPASVSLRAGPEKAMPAASSVVSEKSRQLCALAEAIVASVLDDPTITPAGAFDAVRDELAAILALPTDPVADQLGSAAVQLSERLRHQAPGEVILTPQEASRLLAVLTALSGLLARITNAGQPGCEDRGLVLAQAESGPAAEERRDLATRALSRARAARCAAR